MKTIIFLLLQPPQPQNPQGLPEPNPVPLEGMWILLLAGAIVGAYHLLKNRSTTNQP